MNGGAATLYRDLRIGGAERLVFAKDRSFLMQVPDDIRKCVGFIGYTNVEGQRKLAGTAFFVSYELEDSRGAAFVYLVTAKHVIDNIRDKNASAVEVRLNFRDGNAKWITTHIQDWLFHPDDDFVDVAVLQIVIPDALQVDYRRFNVKGFATDQVIKDEWVGVGDEVFLTGLFINHYGLKANIPIVRVGNIAAMPEEKVEVKDLGLIDAYLVEARSIGGLSGSPVFVYIGPLRMKDRKLEIPIGEDKEFKIFYLLGLMHGHYDVKPLPDEVNVDSLDKETVNMGIAIVVPASKILEVLDQPMLKKQRAKDESAFRKRQQEKLLPTAAAGDATEPFRENAFEDALKRASRIAPESPSKDSDTTE
jgi:hypothetical protein